MSVPAPRTSPLAGLGVATPVLPSGYPALRHLTSPLRRAAAAAGDPGTVHLWAGTGYRQAVRGPAADVLRILASAS